MIYKTVAVLILCFFLACTGLAAASSPGESAKSSRNIEASLDSPCTGRLTIAQTAQPEESRKIDVEAEQIKLENEIRGELVKYNDTGEISPSLRVYMEMFKIDNPKYAGKPDKIIIALIRKSLAD